jgi:hypothetical protein
LRSDLQSIGEKDLEELLGQVVVTVRATVIPTAHSAGLVLSSLNGDVENELRGASA